MNKIFSQSRNELRENRAREGTNVCLIVNEKQEEIHNVKSNRLLLLLDFFLFSGKNDKALRKRKENQTNLLSKSKENRTWDRTDRLFFADGCWDGRKKTLLNWVEKEEFKLIRTNEQIQIKKYLQSNFHRLRCPCSNFTLRSRWLRISALQWDRFETVDAGHIFAEAERKKFERCNSIVARRYLVSESWSRSWSALINASL